MTARKVGRLGGCLPPPGVATRLPVPPPHEEPRPRPWRGAPQKLQPRGQTSYANENGSAVAAPVLRSYASMRSVGTVGAGAVQLGYSQRSSSVHQMTVGAAHIGCERSFSMLRMEFAPALYRTKHPRQASSP